MSKEIHVSFEIHSMSILKKTLADLNINYDEESEKRIFIARQYHPIVFDQDTNEILCDDMDQIYVNEIKRIYTANAYKDKIIREGSRFQERVMTDGSIYINIL